MTQVHLSLKSRNEKTGAIPVSTTAASSCPPSCPFNHENEGGCYAEENFHLRLHWQQVSAGKRGTDWLTYCASIALLADGQVWRHNQAGDLPGIGDDIDVEELELLVESNRGKRGFTYTHKPIGIAANAAAIRHANENGFTVNLSGNNLPHADELLAAGIGPVVSVVPSEYGRKAHGKIWLEALDAYKARLAALPQATPAGAPIAVCPATYLDTVTCASCQLCQRQNRKVVVVFPAHGAGTAKANNVAKG